MKRSNTEKLWSGELMNDTLARWFSLMITGQVMEIVFTLDMMG
jgi:hypothetical protein